MLVWTVGSVADFRRTYRKRLLGSPAVSSVLPGTACDQSTCVPASVSPSVVPEATRAGPACTPISVPGELAPVAHSFQGEGVGVVPPRAHSEYA